MYVCVCVRACVRACVRVVLAQINHATLNITTKLKKIPLTHTHTHTHTQSADRISRSFRYGACMRCRRPVRSIQASERTSYPNTHPSRIYMHTYPPPTHPPICIHTYIHTYIRAYHTYPTRTRRHTMHRLTSRTGLEARIWRSRLLSATAVAWGWW